MRIYIIFNEEEIFAFTDRDEAEKILDKMGGLSAVDYYEETELDQELLVGPFWRVKYNGDGELQNIEMKGGYQVYTEGEFEELIKPKTIVGGVVEFIVYGKDFDDAYTNARMIYKELKENESEGTKTKN